MPPFVHLFQTRDRKYAYDVNSNHIVEVGDAVFRMLEAMHRGESEESILRDLSPRHEPQVIAQAFAGVRRMREEEGLFLDRHPEYAFRQHSLEHLQVILDSPLQVLTLGVTDSCNLRCSYCIYSGGTSGRRVHGNRAMTACTARRAVDHLRGRSRGNGASAIGFYGGEPLLQFPLVQATTEYALAVLPRESTGFTLTTNGTLLTGRVLDFLERHRFHVLVSLDGPRDYHDRHRTFRNHRGSWDAVMRNLELMERRNPSLFHELTRLSVVVSPPASFRELDEFFVGLGLPVRVALEEQAGVQADSSSLTDYDYALEKFVRGAIEGRFQDPRIPPEYRFVYSLLEEGFRKIHLRTERARPLEAPSLHGMCVPGGFKLFVGPDGTLYPCEKLEGYPRMRLGHLDTGVDPHLVAGLFSQFRAIGFGECSRCWIRRFCSACVLHTLSDGIPSRARLDGRCAIRRRYNDRTNPADSTRMERNPRAFQRWERQDGAGTA